MALSKVKLRILRENLHETNEVTMSLVNLNLNRLKIFFFENSIAQNVLGNQRLRSFAITFKLQKTTTNAPYMYTRYYSYLL